MSIEIHKSWKDKLFSEFKKEYFKDLTSFVKKEYAKHTVYPPSSKIFNAFEYCNWDDVKVVIIGQDPYHWPEQANGLSFSVSDDVRIPPSLRNIYKELKSDLGIDSPETGNLECWAKQGVLLLNATLTVRHKSPNSHKGKGWEQFTDEVIKVLSDKKEHVVFILWGAYAKKKGSTIDRSKHKVLESTHPSPFAAYKGFFGSKVFSKTNKYLEDHHKDVINW